MQAHHQLQVQTVKPTPQALVLLGCANASTKQKCIEPAGQGAPRCMHPLSGVHSRQTLCAEDGPCQREGRGSGTQLHLVSSTGAMQVEGLRKYDDRHILIFLHPERVHLHLSPAHELTLVLVSSK
jgi:hypothetical protein